jgi:hypothetical protein
MFVELAVILQETFTYDIYVLFFFVKIYLQDVNTHTSVLDSTKLFLVSQFTCRTLAVRGVTVLPRQVMGGTAVKIWHKRINTSAEWYEIRG